MRLISGALAVLFLVACADTLPAARQSQPPTSTAPGPASSGRVATSPAITPPAVTTLSFSCRLPFAQDVSPGQWRGGFIDFPSGVFTSDPSAPRIPGYYDRAVSKWLPVPRNLVAPDGLHYAYTTGGIGQTPGPLRLHVVDAASGVDKVIPLALSDQQTYWVADYAPEGIYIESGWEVARYGSWRVDPIKGTLTDLGKQEHFVDDGTGHAWVAVFDARDPHPARSSMTGDPLPNEVGRRDLKTGTVEVWFYKPGFNVAPSGAFVDGGLLVWVEPSIADTSIERRHEYWLAGAPGMSRRIAYIEGGSGSLADRHGIWMGSIDGLYLITPDGNTQLVSNLRGDPGNGCV